MATFDTVQIVNLCHPAFVAEHRSLNFQTYDLSCDYGSYYLFNNAFWRCADHGSLAEAVMHEAPGQSTVSLCAYDEAPECRSFIEYELDLVDGKVVDVRLIRGAVVNDRPPADYRSHALASGDARGTISVSLNGCPKAVIAEFIANARARVDAIRDAAGLPDATVIAPSALMGDESLTHPPYRATHYVVQRMSDIEQRGTPAELAVRDAVVKIYLDEASAYR